MTTLQYNQYLQREDICFRLAAGVLLHKKEISFSEIKGLPMVENDREVERIIKRLMSYYNPHKVNKKIATYPALQWEIVLSLKEKKRDNEDNS